MAIGAALLAAAASQAEYLRPAEAKPALDAPADVGRLTPDAAVTGAPLQITEILPDSADIAGADAYEFVEVFNASSEPVDFGDYALSYLYPQDSTVNKNEAVWPATSGDTTIPAGEALVLWVKNDANARLTAADFNAHFSSDLVMGDDLVTVDAPGMSSTSARGFAIRTNTGVMINRALYAMPGESGDGIVADRGVRYAPGDDAELQRMVSPLPASPGRVQVDQAAGGLIVPAADSADPVITDATAHKAAAGADIDIVADIADDSLVKTVTMTLSNDIDDEPHTVGVRLGDDGRYRHTIVAADAMGKAHYEYTITASDGTHEVTTEPRRIDVTGLNTSPVRLGLRDGDLVRGTLPVTATGDDVVITIDGARVDSGPSLESVPRFVFETSQTDYYFRNGVRIGDDVLRVFDEGTYEKTETITVPIDLTRIARDEPLTVSVWAGTKAGPFPDTRENADDFVISGMRLVLPDGRTLRSDADGLVQMGDSDGKNPSYDSVFDIPDDAFDSITHTWDTSVLADGTHTVEAESPDGSAIARVTVDNTAPTIALSVVDGHTYQGGFELDAEFSEPVGTAAFLDGSAIDLGETVSSTRLSPGPHEFRVRAEDAAGNTTDESVTFLTPEENPSAELLDDEAGRLRARVTDPTGDTLDVSFRVGSRHTLGGGVRAAGGSATGADALADASVVDGLKPVATATGLPYQLFEVDVPTGSDADSTVRLAWQGTANAGAQVFLSALRADGSGWEELDRARSGDDGIALSGRAALADVDRDGVITVLVQHTDGYAGENLSARDSIVDPYHPDDTPRGDYDFTIAWESDPQYYNEHYTQHQRAIHDFLLDQREAKNIQYLVHTGDIVDDYDQRYQWENADPQYRRLDDAGLPYGVLAGNHDVGHGISDYANFGAYFGAARYAHNPWYGGDYENNRGHYDLFTAGGIDFVAVYMGWDPGDDEIAWMNEVLARYPERLAIVGLHEFLLASGGLGPVPQRIMDDVVAANPNVRIVMSGHYHDAYTRVDEFDDDGDGVADRTVHSMLFDYQELPEGGLGYLRLLHFDNVGERVVVRTFSPSLGDYDSDEPALLAEGADPYAKQEFEISYADLGLEVEAKRLKTTGFTADVLGTTEIGRVAGLRSGSIADAPDAHTGWYVHTTDGHGGSDDSEVRSPPTP